MTEGGRAVVSPDTNRTDRVPPGQKVSTKWPVLHRGRAGKIDLSTWNLEVRGLVDNPLRLDWDAFSKLPRTEVESDIHCVTGWSRLDNLWEGVSAQTLVDLARPQTGVCHVAVFAARGYTTNLEIDEFLRGDVLLATHHDGQPLDARHGGPIRLVVPGLYFWKSAKWLEGLEFREVDRPGFWETHGYHNHGDPWTEERYSGRF